MPVPYIHRPKAEVLLSPAGHHAYNLKECLYPGHESTAAADGGKAAAALKGPSWEVNSCRRN